MSLHDLPALNATLNGLPAPLPNLFAVQTLAADVRRF